MSASPLTNENVPPLGGARAWLIWSLSALAFGYAFFQRVAPSVMVSDLMADFAIGGGMLGVLSALYFYPYVILQVPLGALLDRLGARWLLVIALTFAGVGSILFGSAANLPMAYVGRIMIGAGSAVGFLASMSLASKWFPPNRFAQLVGMTMFFGMMSGVAAQGPLALFVEQVGWRAVQWYLGGFALFLALLVFLIVRNSPNPVTTENQPKEEWASIFLNVKMAASRWDVWKIALVAAAMSGPMLTLGGLWGTPYVMSAFDLPRPEAAFWVSLTLFGWAIGAPVSGWLSDRFEKRKIFLVFASGIMSVALLVMTMVPDIGLYGVVAMLSVVGVTGGVMVTSFALAREVLPVAITGSALGIINGMTVFSGSILQPLVGVGLDAMWDGTVVDGSRIYQPEQYQLAFGLVFAVAVIGFILALTLKEEPAS